MEPIASTTARLFRKATLLLTILVLGPPLFAVDLPSFARSLEKEGDWYRAIGVWKEVRFTDTDEATFWSATQAIVLDYWKANQDALGLQELARLEAALSQATVERQKAAFSWAGLFQYRLKRLPEAEYAWARAQNDLYLGLLEARIGHTDEAAVRWKNFSQADALLPLTDSRSPLVAGALSLAFPGAGQAYAGHWFDGAQALGMVGFFGFAAYGTYLYDSHFSNNYVLTGLAAGVALVFEAANLYGAAKTADYFNQNKEAERTAVWEKAVFQQPLPQF